MEMQRFNDCFVNKMTFLAGRKEGKEFSILMYQARKLSVPSVCYYIDSPEGYHDIAKFNTFQARIPKELQKILSIVPYSNSLFKNWCKKSWAAPTT